MILPGMPRPSGRKGKSLTIAGVATAASSGTSVTCNVPSGTQDGDFLVALVNNNVSRTPNALSGWTLAFQSLGTPTFAIYTRAASSEPASYTFVFSGLGNDKRATILTIRGATQLGTIGTPARNNSAVTITATAITAIGGGLLLAWFTRGASSSPAPTTPPADMDLASAPDATVPGAFVYSQIQSAGSTGTKTATWASNVPLGALLLEVLP